MKDVLINIWLLTIHQNDQYFELKLCFHLWLLKSLLLEFFAIENPFGKISVEGRFQIWNGMSTFSERNFSHMIGSKKRQRLSSRKFIVETTVWVVKFNAEIMCLIEELVWCSIQEVTKRETGTLNLLCKFWIVRHQKCWNFFHKITQVSCKIFKTFDGNRPTTKKTSFIIKFYSHIVKVLRRAKTPYVEYVNVTPLTLVTQGADHWGGTLEPT